MNEKEKEWEEKVERQSGKRAGLEPQPLDVTLDQSFQLLGLHFWSYKSKTKCILFKWFGGIIWLSDFLTDFCESLSGSPSTWELVAQTPKRLGEEKRMEPAILFTRKSVKPCLGRVNRKSGWERIRPLCHLIRHLHRQHFWQLVLHSARVCNWNPAKDSAIIRMFLPNPNSDTSYHHHPSIVYYARGYFLFLDSSLLLPPFLSKNITPIS
jgi:hypothetical protein